MSDSKADLVLEPDEFFKRSASLLGAAAIVAVIGVVSAVSAAAPFLQILSAFEGGAAQGIFTGIAVVTVGLALVGPFFVWALYAGLAHLVTLFFDGEGNFSNTVALVGWAMAPRVLGVLIALALSLYFVWQMPSFESAQQMMEYSQQMQNSTLNQVSRFLIVPFKLWSGALVVFAVSHARNVSRKQAAIATAAPLVIDVGYVVVIALLGLVL